MKYPITRLPQSSDIRYARSQVAAASAYALDTPGVSMAGTNALRAFTIACEIARTMIGNPEAHSGTFDAAITKRHAELIKTQAWGVAHALACWAGYYVREPEEVPVTGRTQKLWDYIGGRQLPPGTRIVAALPPVPREASDFECVPPIQNRFAELARNVALVDQTVQARITHAVGFVSDDGADPDAPIPYAPVRDADVHPEELGGLGMEGRADFGEKMLHDAELDANEYGVAEALCQLRHVCRRKGIDIVDVMRASLAQYERDLEIG